MSKRSRNDFYLKAVTSHLTDNWSTPKFLYDFFKSRGFYDPCPLDDNGIGAFFGEWPDKTFVNPPYSDIERFARYAYSFSLNGARICLLLPSRTDTNWFRFLYERSYYVIFIHGRLKFGDSKTCAPFGSVIFCLDQEHKIEKNPIVRCFDSTVLIDWLGKLYA